MEGDGPTFELSPVQARTLALLRRPEEPFIHDPDQVTALDRRAREGVAELSERLGGEQLWVSKHFLAKVHGCEVNHLLPDDFAWRPATAAGFVAHRAIELHVNWRGTPTPGEVVDDAIARIADESSGRGDYVAGISESDRAALRSRAIERVTRFVQDFPPLDLRAHPMLEASLKWRPEGCVELGGKADLVMGRRQGRESRVLIIDFKTGGRAAVHRDDLRFYALLETLVAGVPPRRLVTYYLDYGECEVEDVTIELLRASLDRTLAGIAVHAELAVEQRPPTLRPGRACRWCAVIGTCAEGRAHLGTDGDDDPS